MASPDRSARPAPIMLSVGEASGDLHGATLCRALRALEPDARLVGIRGGRTGGVGRPARGRGVGGSPVAAAGVEVILDPPARGAVGRSGALGRIPSLYRAY